MVDGRGLFIVIDGIDGAGKTTLAGRLVAYEALAPTIRTKEPTTLSAAGRRLRQSAQTGRLGQEEELRLFTEDRLHHIREHIVPNLEAGTTVICDRYYDSTLAFQCMTPAEADAKQHAFERLFRVPDVTFLLDCPVPVGLSRVGARGEQRSAFETDETLERARAIYESRQGAHYAHLDATGTADAVFAAARETLQARGLIPPGSGAARS